MFLIVISLLCWKDSWTSQLAWKPAQWPVRSFSFYSCNNQHLMLVPFCLKDLGSMRTSQLPSAGTGSLLSLVPDVSYRIAQSELLWSLVFEASILDFQCLWNSPLSKIESSAPVTSWCSPQPFISTKSLTAFVHTCVAFIVSQTAPPSVTWGLHWWKDRSPKVSSLRGRQLPESCKSVQGSLLITADYLCYPREQVTILL